MSLAVLDELRAIGVEVVPFGDNLVIRPASKVPPELKERLKANKAEVLAALKARPATQPEPSPPVTTSTPAPDPVWDPPLGAERGVMTIADLPELERRLRLSGWKVARRGNELICTSGRKAWIQ
jgi:hypothetical protein